MPAPEHLRITFSGSIGQDVPAPEEFAFGVSASPGAATLVSRGSLGALAASLDPVLEAFRGSVSAACRFRRIRVAYIGNNGRTIRDANGAYLHGDANITKNGGASDSNIPPPQTALAISLYSDFVGPTGRGRFFIPIPGGGVEPGPMLMPVLAHTQHADRAEAFILGINNALSAAGFGPVVVASGGSAVNGYPPALHTVQRVRVGRAFDTVRSRRSQLEEQYLDRSGIGPF